MSGPKRADVKAALDVAQGLERRCATLVAEVERTAGDAMLKSARRQAKSAQEAVERLRAGLLGIESTVTATLKSWGGVANRAQQALATAEHEIEAAVEGERVAGRLFDEATEVFAEARAAYDRAEAHYLHDEMAIANRAKAVFGKATKKFVESRNGRRRASVLLQEVVRETAVLSPDDVRRLVDAARAEQVARTRAVEEARKVTDRQQREAGLALAEAAAVVGGVAHLPHEDFRPGILAEIRKDLEAAGAMLSAGRANEARTCAEATRRRAAEALAEITAAVEERERQRAKAAAAAGDLAAFLDGLGAEREGLIRAWAPQTDATEQARKGLEVANNSAASGRFEESTASAVAARDALAKALEQAAENHAKHTERSSIASNVMAVLHEMGYDVSFDEGTRDAPIRISAASPSGTGEGDFEVSLPLEGEADFEVKEPGQGDECVAAVETLRRRLADRGLHWDVTDWGRAGERKKQTAPVTSETPTAHGQKRSRKRPHEERGM